MENNNQELFHNANINWVRLKENYTQTLINKEKIAKFLLHMYYIFMKKL